MLALIQQGSGALIELTSEMENSGGTAQRIADTQLDTFQGQMTLLKSGAEGLALAIGGGLVPSLRPLVEILTEIVQRVVNWAEAHPRLFEAIVAVTTIMGFLALAMGALLIVVGLLIPAVATLGITLTIATGGIILAIGLLVAGGVLLYQNWDQVQEVGERVWNAILQAVQNAVNWIIDGINGLLSVYAGFARTLVDGANLIAGVFGVELPAGIDKFIDALESGIPKVDFYDEKQRQLAETAALTEDALDEEGGAVAEAGDAHEDAAGQVDQAGEAIEAIAEVASSATEELDYMAIAAQELADEAATLAEQEGVAAAKAELMAEAHQALADDVDEAGGAADQTADTVQRLIDQEEAAGSAATEAAAKSREWLESLDGLTDALEEDSGAVQENAETIQHNIDFQEGLRDATDESAEALEGKTEAVEAAQDALDNYAPALTELEELTRAATAADEELEAAKQTLIKVMADDKSTTDEVTAARDRFRHSHGQCGCGKRPVGGCAGKRHRSHGRADRGGQRPAYCPRGL